jgi:hypothetical protein|tara:strand:+ start:11327 stop:12004 length:678 start_codon:yes stop_codon:yes gene_type:complete
MDMKLSEKTINLLENFSSINQSILVKRGSKLRTISVMKNILAEADVDENFERDFGIYDLPQFLNGVNLMKDPDLDLKNETYMIIREGKSTKVKFAFADPDVIITPPEKPITLPSSDVTFALDSAQLGKLLKASSVYQLPDLAAVGNGKEIKMVVSDRKNDNSNEFSLVVGDTDSVFEFNFKIENIKLIPGSYDVQISKKLLSKFTNSQYNLDYFIALEPDSVYDE